MSDKTPVDRTVDELELQAWLARAEFRNPSLHHAGTQDEVKALARLRDELRLQLALGKLEARAEWGHLEDRWRRIQVAASRTADEAGETLHDLLGQIREGYHRIRSA